jgi:hypothetical protein
MRKYGIRIGVTLGLVIIYFFLLRPLRAELNKYIYQPIVEKSMSQNERIYTDKEASSVSNYIFWSDGDAPPHVLSIKFPFGLHFLLGIIGLVILGAKKSFYIYLVSIQVFGSLSALLCLYLGSLTIIQLLVISDLLLRYLIPLCSLGMVPLAFIYQKQITHER